MAKIVQPMVAPMTPSTNPNSPIKASKLDMSRNVLLDVPRALSFDVEAMTPPIDQIMAMYGGRAKSIKRIPKDRERKAENKQEGAAIKHEGVAIKHEVQVGVPVDANVGYVDKQEGAVDKQEGVADKQEGAADTQEGAADKQEGAADKQEGAADKQEDIVDQRLDSSNAASQPKVWLMLIVVAAIASAIGFGIGASMFISPPSTPNVQAVLQDKSEIVAPQGQRTDIKMKTARDLKMKKAQDAAGQVALSILVAVIATDPHSASIAGAAHRWLWGLAARSGVMLSAATSSMARNGKLTSQMLAAASIAAKRSLTHNGKMAVATMSRAAMGARAGSVTLAHRLSMASMAAAEHLSALMLSAATEIRAISQVTHTWFQGASHTAGAWLCTTAQTTRASTGAAVARTLASTKASATMARASAGLAMANALTHAKLMASALASAKAGAKMARASAGLAMAKALTHAKAGMAMARASTVQIVSMLAARSVAVAMLAREQLSGLLMLLGNGLIHLATLVIGWAEALA